MKKNKNSISTLGDEETLRFLKPQSVVNQIYKDLGRAIAKGELPPGMPLKEAELQDWFGVSRAPIREAIRMLQADDLVIIDEFKKKYVRQITRSYLEDLIPVIERLEGYGAGLAARKITDNEIDELKNINESMRVAYSEKKYELCPQLNFDFHRIYIKSANNQVLNTTIRSMKKTIIWFWLTNFAYKNHEMIPISISEHDLIIQEFIDHNSRKAEKVVRTHIVNILERSLKNINFDSNGIPFVEKKEESTELSQET